MPLVSVIIPCFNAAANIAETIASAREQVLDDFELIVIDDGSSDQSRDVILSMAAKDARIRAFSRNNQGVAATRNEGVARAKSPIIAFLDADDRWRPTFLSKMVSTLDSHPEADVAFARCRIIDCNGRHTGEVSRPKLRDIGPVDLIRANPTTTTSNLVVRRDAFLQSGGFISGMQHAEDQEWLLRMVSTGHRIVGVDDLLVDYRNNETGLSSDLEAMRRGFEEFTAKSAEYHPSLTPLVIRRARSGYHGYLARRAVRLHYPPAIAWDYLMRAVQLDPAFPIHNIRSFGRTLAAVLSRSLRQQLAASVNCLKGSNP